MQSEFGQLSDDKWPLSAALSPRVGSVLSVVPHYLVFNDNTVSQRCSTTEAAAADCQSPIKGKIETLLFLKSLKQHKLLVPVIIVREPSIARRHLTRLYEMRIVCSVTVAIDYGGWGASSPLPHSSTQPQVQGKKGGLPALHGWRQCSRQLRGIPKRVNARLGQGCRGAGGNGTKLGLYPRPRSKQVG